MELPGNFRSGYRSSSVVPEYFRRMIKPKQMDFEYAMWQMFHLCVAPRKVFRNMVYHKHASDHWARDDPAFVVVSVAFLTIASLAYGIAFRASLWAVLKLLLWSVFVDFVAVGMLVATVGWWVANTFLRSDDGASLEAASNERLTSLTLGADPLYGEFPGGSGPPPAMRSPKVEWLYAFDIHCNAFFPLFVVLYVVQFALLFLILSNSIVAPLVSNALYVIATLFYYYITFLGYSELSFLSRTNVFLYPAVVFVILFTILTLLQYNISAAVFSFYFA
ncbi:uncharacterized protein AMSG_01573 [Thecamonas trahens ATCC 50062]|uniref:UNC-50 family protein n=1 Tax=Thecamonas trahens ATCC 50062 TaxID=461836 RepID=A0A0L0DTE4_THETB|nr:hypothetical protein AMSG_01573 [Thecamonas trahens ATCC 50062]KNC54723.1 hypothetical protein AMSG_01573 [Thecamonas trahens ATCC 50062]|eukprot:XP_013761623.1 hypothetical protein AMSG_01573 [Thecamonas trahens ATCC 50062]